MASTPSAEEKARKVKSLLASYYAEGVEDEPQSSSAAAAAGPEHPRQPSARGAARELEQLDEPDFDAETYLKRLLKETRLAELADKHKEMVTEVGSLDSDMQMLVYENYNKFIAATDTIKLMNSSMEGMDERTLQLQRLIEGAVEMSSQVKRKLEARQEHIEELNRTRLLLHKLQSVFDLPRALRVAIDSQAYEVAADRYHEAAPLLDKYGHKGAFKRVNEEATACRQELVATLKQKLRERPDEAAECIQLIAKLGEATESLQDEYLACKRRRMEDLLQAAGVALKEAAVRAGLLDAAALQSVDKALLQRAQERYADRGLREVLVGLDSAFFTELGATSALFAQLFDRGARPRLIKVGKDLVQAYCKLVRRGVCDLAATSAAAAAGISVSGDLLAPLSQLAAGGSHVDGVSLLARAAVESSMARSWGAGALLHGLHLVRADLSRLEGLLPEVSPRNRADEVVEHAVRQHLGLCLAAVECRVLSTLGDISSGLSTSGRASESAARLNQGQLQRGLAILQAILQLGLTSLLASVKQYDQQAWVLESWREAFATLVHSSIMDLLLALAAQARAACAHAGGSRHAGEDAAQPRGYGVEVPAPFAMRNRSGAEWLGAGAPPVLLLLLSRLLTSAEQELLPALLERLYQMFGGSITPGGDMGAFSTAEVGRALHEASAALMRGYISAHASALADAVVRDTEATDWRGHQQPRAPRPVCTLLLDSLADIELELGALGVDPPGGQAHSRKPSTSSSLSRDSPRAGSARAQRSAGDRFMEATVLQILSQSDGQREQAEFSTPGVLGAVACAVLRSKVGAVRQQTLGRGGFQQLQLDVHYMRPALQRAVAGSRDAASIMQQLDELLASAMERCSEPLMFETAVLDKLVGAWLAARPAATAAAAAAPR